MTAFDTKDGSADIKTYLNPLVMWIWISVGFYVLGTIIAMLPARRGRVVEDAPAVAATASPTEDAQRELVAR